MTVPQAHRVVNEQALRAGLPVLCEKPLAPTVAEALRQVALADVTGGLLMVSQSRRYFNHLAAFRGAVARARPARHGQRAVLPRGSRARIPRADGASAARRHVDPPLRPAALPHRRRAGRGALQLVEPAVELVRRRRRRDRRVRARLRRAVRLRGQPVHAADCRRRGTPTGASTASAAPPRWDGDERRPGRRRRGRLRASRTGSEGIEGSLEEFVASLRSGTTPQNEVRANVLQPRDGRGRDPQQRARRRARRHRRAARGVARPGDRRRAARRRRRRAAHPGPAPPTASPPRPGDPPRPRSRQEAPDDQHRTDPSRRLGREPPRADQPGRARASTRTACTPRSPTASAACSATT